jgi:SIR2-like domain
MRDRKQGANLARDQKPMPPTAATITVAEVLDLLDTSFSAVADSIARRGFTLWVGSGISLGRAPSVGSIIARALEHLRQNISAGDPNCRFRRALDEALVMIDLSPAERGAIRFDLPFDIWPEKTRIIDSLWDSYASVLGIPVDGEPDDYMIWEAVDVRATFGTLNDPDCEHLCIAILIMEGAIAEIASANWDGLIEAAILRLSGGNQFLQVVVDPNHLRDPPRRARLMKFHGCAIHATADPATYRQFMTATRPQITNWPHNPLLTALRTVLTGVATNSRTLMIGLSLQDTNLQDLFAAARAVHPWPWPIAPEAQAHVFCADRLGTHHTNMLQVVYGAAYGPNRAAITAAALISAYAKPALLGLVLHVLNDKLLSLALRCCGAGLALASSEIKAGLQRLRDCIAALAVDDALGFLNAFIVLWSRGISLFRRGDIPAPGPQHYEPISLLSVEEMAGDPNVDQSGLPEFAIGLALIGRGNALGRWTLSMPAGLGVEHGIFQATGVWTTAQPAQIYFVSSAAAALELLKRGVITHGNDIIFHSDDAWKQMMENGGAGRRSPTAASGRTGRPSARHVSIRQLVQAAPDLAFLSQRFEEEMTL